jgi:hypothetical protein
MKYGRRGGVGNDITVRDDDVNRKGDQKRGEKREGGMMLKRIMQEDKKKV